MATQRLPAGQPSRENGMTFPVLGLFAAFALCAAVAALELLLTRNAPNPGLLLDWFPLVAAAGAFLLALRATESVRESAMAATIAFLALFPLVNPSPALWMYAGPAVAVVMALGLQLAPATRIVAAVPALTGLLVAVALLPSGNATTSLMLTLVALYLLALMFLVPTASGLRRIPFAASVALGLLIPLAFAAALAINVATAGVTTSSDRSDGFAGGPGLLTLALLALVVAYPIVVLRLGRSPRAQAFLLPSFPLPRIGTQARRVEGAESSDQA